MTEDRVVPAADIDKLRTRVAELKGDLARAEAELQHAEVAASPYHVGDVVEVASGWSDSRTWQPAIVRQVTARSYGGLTIKVSLQRKGGGWMDRETTVWGGIRKPA